MSERVRTANENATFYHCSSICVYSYKVYQLLILIIKIADRSSGLRRVFLLSSFFERSMTINSFSWI